MTIPFLARWRAPGEPGAGLREFALLAAILLAAYGAALAVPFAYHDDYYYFAYDRRTSFHPHPQFFFSLFTGRPLYVAVATLMAPLLWVVSDFTLVRGLFILALALAAWGVMRLLVRLGLPRWHALAVAAGLFLLPGAQAGVLLVTMAPFCVALILSLLAARVAFAVPPGALWRKEARAQAARRCGLAALLLLAALFVYQPWAMFFVVAMFARTLFGPPAGARPLLARLALDGAIFAAACLAFFALHKLVIVPLLAHAFPGHFAGFAATPAYAFELASDPAALLRRFTHGVVLQGAKLWSPQTPFAAVLAVLALLALGGAMSLRAVARGALSRAEWAARAAALLALSAVAVLPVLAAAGGHTGYRVIWPFSAVLVIALYASLAALLGGGGTEGRRAGALSALLLAALLAASAAAFLNVRASALNAHLEFSLLRGALVERINRGEPLCHVHLALTRPGRSFLGLPETGNTEFNVNSSAFWQNAPWMIRAALGELADRRHFHVVRKEQAALSQECSDGRKTVTVTTGAPGAPYRAFPQTVLIDLNPFLPPAAGPRH